MLTGSESDRHGFFRNFFWFCFEELGGDDEDTEHEGGHVRENNCTRHVVGGVDEVVVMVAMVVVLTCCHGDVQQSPHLGVVDISK